MSNAEMLSGEIERAQGAVRSTLVEQFKAALFSDWEGILSTDALEVIYNRSWSLGEDASEVYELFQEFADVVLSVKRLEM